MESGSSRFQPGEGPSRGLLRDYEPSDGTFEALVISCLESGCGWRNPVSDRVITKSGRIAHLTGF